MTNRPGVKAKSSRLTAHGKRNWPQESVVEDVLASLLVLVAAEASSRGQNRLKLSPLALKCSNSARSGLPGFLAKDRRSLVLAEITDRRGRQSGCLGSSAYWFARIFVSNHSHSVSAQLRHTPT